MSRTVRTEVTVERQGVTVLLDNAAKGFDTCPLCGARLREAQAEQARLRLPEGSISQDSGVIDAAAETVWPETGAMRNRKRKA